MHIIHEAPLAPLTTLGLGGPAAALVELHDSSDFPDAMAYMESVVDHRGPPVVLGLGSNALIHDAGCSAPVLRMANRGIRFLKGSGDDRVLMEVQAGHPLADVVEGAVAEDLTGMEMLSGIPGTTGATPVQNVGAYGQETSDILVEVHAWDRKLQRRVTLSAAACQLGHRTSVFKRSRRWILLSLVFALRRSPLSAPLVHRQVAAALDVPLGSRVPQAEAARAVLAVRRGKGMVLNCSARDSRSCGSVFLSPEISPAQADRLRPHNAPVHRFPDGSTRVSASWLLRESGFDLGSPLAAGVRVSSLHHTLVAEEGATAAAFAQATDVVRRAVHERTGVLLTPEIDFLGDWEPDPAARRVPNVVSGPPVAIGESWGRHTAADPGATGRE
ncbi:UDP-N-acetylmuramate dehydrogenase [Streptomyces sp. NPDC053427]|uniref:UDP-N-acetylmuramate dehydrogenase n=1 Tax=Streptomyces sp. NPDC053427 TaxID=3365701 RepID=UPI0037CF222B